MIHHITHGEVSIAALTTFGVSAKEDAGSAIGQFGTGFKYAVATILRNGGEITISIDGAPARRFYTQPETIRGQEFHMIYLEGHGPLGLTTHVGKNWAMWMAFRELHSNTLDEGGETCAGYAPNPAYRCVISVKHPLYEKVYHDRDKYFLNAPCVHGGKILDLHRGQSNAVFLRGVRVHEMQEPLPHTVNLTSKDTWELTEDRTLKYVWGLDGEIRRVYAQDEKFLHELFNHKHLKFVQDFTLDFDLTAPLGQVAAERIQAGKYLPEAVRAKYLKLATPLTPTMLNPAQDRMLQSVISLMSEMQMPLGDVEIIVTNEVGNSILGRWEDGKILLSPRNFTLGKRQLLQTLVEEWAHMTSGYSDYTHAFQEFIIGELVLQGLRAIDKEDI